MASTVPSAQRLRDASRHFAADRIDDAKAILDTLAAPSDLADCAAFVHLHRALGQPRTDVETKLETRLSDDAKTAPAKYARAEALFLLGRDEALGAAQDAADAAGGDEAPTLLLLKIHLDADRPDDATAVAFKAADHRTEPGGLLLASAKILGQAGHKDHAMQLLEAARPHHQGNLDEFNFVAAGITGTQPAGADQSGMAEAIFDKFAGDYDSVLTKIGYSAPDMIGDLLKASKIAKMKRLRVLDAGCGTGLCAKLLRPYAKRLDGIDISAGMLQKAKKRKLYNGLTRSDLNVSATIPQGPFDLIVLADVLIYFGDLAPVLASLSQRLPPGGWLLLTVEDGGALDAPGYSLGASGRYKHSEAHISAALIAAGLGKPKHSINKTLRHEFGVPIEGIAVAAQKPMLAF